MRHYCWHRVNRIMHFLCYVGSNVKLYESLFMLNHFRYIGDICCNLWVKIWRLNVKSCFFFCWSSDEDAISAFCKNILNEQRPLKTLQEAPKSSWRGTEWSFGKAFQLMAEIQTAQSVRGYYKNHWVQWSAPRIDVVALVDFVSAVNVGLFVEVFEVSYVLHAKQWPTVQTHTKDTNTTWF